MRGLLAVVFAVSWIALAAINAFAATHTVTQVGNTFDPPEITIDVGDTVEWVHTAGIHTVTSGTGAMDPEVGLLFDEDLTSAAPLVTFTFNEPGDVPYFCRPHEAVNMRGTIHVESPTAAGDEPAASTWSQIKNLYR
jgi:plastocyanin